MDDDILFYWFYWLKKFFFIFELDNIRVYHLKIEYDSTLV